MYVIVVYDVDVSRVAKINSFLKRYLFWVQNSVFEGEITASIYEEMKKGIIKIIKSADSVRIYKARSPSFIEKEILSGDTNRTSRIL